MFDYLIIGAGLFGSVYARQVAEKGHRALVIDKRSHIGGNCYTRDEQGIDVHVYGPHIFHTNDEVVWQWVNRFMHFNQFTFSPIANYKNHMYSLPFNMWTFYQLWGVTNEEDARSKIAQNNFSAVPDNLENHAISMVGKDIYKTLIEGYTTKQWGLHPRDLPKSIIKRLPVRFQWDNNYFNDKFQGIPSEGYTKMFENILNHENIEVRLKIDFFDDKSDLLKLANQIVYTGPLDRFFNYKYGDLNYRSLRWETERLTSDNFQGCPVINYTDIDTPYTRTIEHKWFNFRNQKGTVVSKEYPDNYRRGKEPFYPCYDELSKSRFAKYKALQKSQPDVLFGGRLAEYKYYDMHQVIASALHHSNHVAPR